MDYKTLKRQWAKRRERIRKLIEDGVPPGEIARRFKVAPSRISHIVRNGK